MRDEPRTCQNCKQEFTIAASDFLFYEKIKVPPPTWCPECRNMRRLAWRNERILYTRACDLCSKQTLSIHHPTVPYKVYCRPCWWSDQWDPMEYGRPFDFSRPFFDQFSELLKAVPRCALMNAKTDNSEYCNETDDIKDSYMAVCTFYGERLLYTYWFGWGNDCVDANYTLKSNLCYEVQDVRDSYNCQYVYNSTNLSDSKFCFNCHDGTNCFMSVNLRHKSYCIRNKQYTKEGYFEELKKYDLSSWTKVQQLKNELESMKLLFPRKYAFVSNSEECTGDYIQHCRNVKFGFDAFENENGKYIYDAGDQKDAMDTTQSGIKSELMYEVQSAAYLYNSHFSNWTNNLVDCEYIESGYALQNCFGCVGLKKKQNCIFNTQYPKEEYEQLRAKIIAHMQKTGEYGEFFPVELSPFAYNETVAHQWYPKTKEEVLARGWRWRDDLPGKYGSGTIAWDNVPDRIADVDEKIAGGIFSCVACSKQYKIVKPELVFYKAHAIPLPRKCPDCRFYDRLKLRNPRKLWSRQCMCGGSGHSWHTARCRNEFETTYAPERKEIVYCEACYQAEVV